MRVFRGLRHPGIAARCALTIGNFDGVHRGHQAMLALLRNEARAPRRAQLRDDLRAASARLLRRAAPQARTGAGAHRHPARQADRTRALRRRPGRGAALRRRASRRSRPRPSSTTCWCAAWARATCWSATTSASAPGAPATTRCSTPPAHAHGFDVARMNSYEVHGLRVSSSAVREALAAGDMDDAAALLGRPYSISGHVVHGASSAASWARARRLGDGFRTLNLRFAHWKPAASGIFAVPRPRPGGDAADGRRQPGRAPVAGPVDVNGGRVLLETHCLDWPAGLGAEGGYGKIIRVELLHKLHDEAALRRPRGPDRRHRAGTATTRARSSPPMRAARRDRPPDHARPNLTRVPVAAPLRRPRDRIALPRRRLPRLATDRLPAAPLPERSAMADAARRQDRLPQPR